MSQKIKWGIVGTGWISDQFVADLAHVTNGEGYAVGSRTIESATDLQPSINWHGLTEATRN
ncbi:putative dehydrogenase [Paenibacillus brasilensis]|uniref:Dehydrogenase n=1 Tax=Paenibacillus brasilensis TaxID=128574 RepID=A0ABU0L2G9_9BACL|nr:putative dehydrogenase [Paenibacillus brasilensis]